MSGDTVALAFDFQELTAGRSSADCNESDSESDHRGVVKKHLVRAGVGIEGKMEELFLQSLLGGLAGEGLAARRAGDDGEQQEVRDGGAGNVDALRVGASVGRGEEEASVVDQGVDQGAVGWSETLQQIAGTEGESNPEALCAGAREERAAGEAFGVGGVGEVEVADVADGLDVVQRQGEDSAGEVEQVDGVVAHETGVGEVSGEGVSGESPNDGFLASSRHGRRRLERLLHGA
jgi:hypothetical protein